jgi:hypothetical protein
MVPELADRVAKLLRLICCETAPDGERLAAASRLSATVTAHNLDWDLAFTNGNADGASSEVGGDAARIKAILDATEQAIELSILSEWETAFLQGISERFNKYKARMYISTKQWVILNRIENTMRCLVCK